VCERIVRAGFVGVDARDLGRETGLDAGKLGTLLDELATESRVLRAGVHRLLASQAVERMEHRLLDALDGYHSAEPLRPGMSRGALRGRLPENVLPESAELAIRRLEESGLVIIEAEHARRSDHSPTLDPEAEAAVAKIREQAREAGLEPASLKDWSESLSISLDLFRDLVAHLERERALVRAKGELWFDAQAVETLCERVVAWFEEHDEIDTPAYKDLIGTTRRTAMPLMELLDDLHVTRRVGDVRVLRKSRS
jgi:selenocysteine-specific elongation factor